MLTCLGRACKLIVYLVAIVFGLVAPLGCETGNAWRQFYRSTGAEKHLQIAHVEDPVIRMVEWGQLETAGNEVQRYLDENKLAREDAGVAAGYEMDRRWLESVRVRDEPGTVVMLGSATFESGIPTGPDDRSLISLASEKGADFVVVATKYAGSVQGYQTVPVYSHTNASVTANTWSQSGWSTTTATGQAGTYSSAVVPATYRRHANTASFWRRITPEERAVLDEVVRSKRGD